LSMDTCILCRGERVVEVKSKEFLLGVASDCRPWPRIGSWVVCEGCGHIQKKIDERWIEDIKKIYEFYEIYHLSGGCEQAIFVGDVRVPRTSVIIDKLRQIADIGGMGRLLDIGCGNGSFLHNFGEKYPKWELFGFDQGDKYREKILGIPNVVGFFRGSLDCISGSFDIVVMTYVIEHLIDPVGDLKRIKRLLTPGGILFIQTSDFYENPFDMVITDHCSHFFVDTLVYSAELADLKVISICKGWIPKEIGIVVRALENDSEHKPPCAIEYSKGLARKSVAWLEGVKKHAQSVADGRNMGIFGTAIAGTWLANNLVGKVNCFVDEDPLKRGKGHMGLPVNSPSDVPAGLSVYIAFPPEMARRLYSRLKIEYPHIDFIVPPEVEAVR